MTRPFHVVVLAAGRGTRMKSKQPKVLFDICGRSALGHVVRLGLDLGAASVTIVVSPDTKEPCEQALGSERVAVVVQDPPRGTGHAAQVALEGLGEATDEQDILILYGDGPLYTIETVRALLEAHERGGDDGSVAAATLLTAEVPDPKGYGRVVTAADGGVDRIVEELDADDELRRIREINTGILVLRASTGRSVIDGLSSDNAKGEVYLTDAVHELRERGAYVGRVALRDLSEANAFNSLAELAVVRDVMRRRIVAEHQANGVDVIDPATTYIDVDVEIGAGTRILPCTVLGRGVVIGRDCVVGPFAHLREAAELDDTAEIGNFVEVKKSRIGKKSKAKHLTYIGDASIGEGTNIGCGTITANWDGKAKHRTTIGDRVFIGSGTVLIAPSNVEDGGVTGAGAIVRRGTTIGTGEVYVGVPARRLDRPAADNSGRTDGSAETDSKRGTSR